MSRRGRIVMLVDNKVDGDSRVQKEARSAAERGWEVILIGRSPDQDTHRWRIGDARVRLVPVPTPLSKRRYEYRRAPLREPLSYPAGRLPAYALEKARARRTEARTKADVLAHKLATGKRSRLTALPGRAWVWTNRAYARATADLVDLRLRRTDALKDRRQRLDSPVDRLSTRFWQKTMGHRAWRKLDPNLWAYELAFGPVIDELAPDLIHANDGQMIGVGARAMLRARRAGRDVKLVWDAHEYLPGRYIHGAHPRWHVAQCAHEREFVRYADAVTTVSEMMVELLTETYDLTVPISIVRNAPTGVGVGAGDSAGAGLGAGLGGEAEPGVRKLCGLDEDVPLLLYVGAMAPQRGVDLMVETLPLLDGVHVAFLARRSKYVESLLDRAAELGAGDRVHLLPYVPVDRIVSHIASADVGLFPAVHILNHEVDLPTKYYEYLQARLPMVVSDVKTSAETTRKLGVGEVFVADDAGDYIRAVETVLANPDRYRDAYAKATDVLADWTWERQAEVLDSVYTSLVPAGPRT